MLKAFRSVKVLWIARCHRQSRDFIAAMAPELVHLVFPYPSCEVIDKFSEADIIEEPQVLSYFWLEFMEARQFQLLEKLFGQQPAIDSQLAPEPFLKLVQLRISCLFLEVEIIRHLLRSPGT